MDVTVPDLGDFSDVEVIEILVKEGDVVAVDDSLLTLETDKATMDVPSPAAGKVVGITVETGSTVSSGDVIVVLETDGTADAGDDQAVGNGGASATADASSPGTATDAATDGSTDGHTDSNTEGNPEDTAAPERRIKHIVTAR